MKYLSQKKNTGGFSLAELIVYCALISLLLGAVIQTAMTMSGVYRRSRAFLDINSAAITAYSRFSRDIRRATAIDPINSTFDATGGKLTLLMKKADGTNDTTAYYVSAGKVKIDENGAYAGDVTQEDMTVSNLTFRKYAQGSSTAIRIEMTLAPEASSTVPALNFYGMYVLRGSYAH
jgi:type II secretory pathway pseudopilin PulG